MVIIHHCWQMSSCHTSRLISCLRRWLQTHLSHLFRINHNHLSCYIRSLSSVSWLRVESLPGSMRNSYEKGVREEGGWGVWMTSFHPPITLGRMAALLPLRTNQTKKNIYIYINSLWWSVVWKWIRGTLPTLWSIPNCSVLPEPFWIDKRPRMTLFTA